MTVAPGTFSSGAALTSAATSLESAWRCWRPEHVCDELVPEDGVAEDELLSAASAMAEPPTSGGQAARTTARTTIQATMLAGLVPPAGQGAAMDRSRPADDSETGRGRGKQDRPRVAAIRRAGARAIETAMVLDRLASLTLAWIISSFSGVTSMRDNVPDLLWTGLRPAFSEPAGARSDPAGWAGAGGFDRRRPARSIEAEVRPAGHSVSVI
jgi:hypothetical protein